MKTFVLLLLFAWQCVISANAGVLSGEPLKTAEPIDLNLPELGDTSQMIFSARDEERIGEQILRQVATSDEVLQDVEVTDYLQALGNRLAAAGPDKQQQFTFFVVKDQSINAFAMPGGVIGVHTGLMLASKSESELASVLGHEIGHVTQHHLARMLESQKNATFKNLAGIAVALLVARSNPQLAQGALTASTAYGVQTRLDYSRTHEREADRVGLTILDQAGFDVRAMPAFFGTMQRHTRFSEGAAPSFLRTHPLTTERIADISNRVQNLPYRQAVDSLDFALMCAKIKASSGLAQVAVERFEYAIATARNQHKTADHYGLAYALLKKNDTVSALKELDWLQKNASAHPAFVELSAQIDKVRRKPLNALNTYTKGMAAFPDYRALIYGKVRLLLATNQIDQAIALIKDKQQKLSGDATLYELLAKAYTAQGKVLLRHYAQAETYYRRFDINRAVEQMDLATKAKDGNFYEKSIAEARLKELRRLQRIEREARDS